MTDTGIISRLSVLLFSDIVGSTGLKSRIGSAAYSTLLRQHNGIFERSIQRFPASQILKHTGDGYIISFSTASDAVRYALVVQELMRDKAWGDHPISARIGIHTGEVAIVTMAGRQDFVGLAADTAARVMSLGAGGQILLTRFAFDEARQFVSRHPSRDPASGSANPSVALRWVAHGKYSLKGITNPIEVFEVGASGVAPLNPPLDGEKAKRLISADEMRLLGWRPAAEQSIPGRTGWTLERKLSDEDFGEVWLARGPGKARPKAFQFCFDPECQSEFLRAVTAVGELLSDPDQPLYREEDLDGVPPMAGAPSAAKPTSFVDRSSMADDDPGEIAEYRIIGKIGEGGLGVVYKAEQHEPLQRTVALKLIKLGMDTRQVIARFDAERQTLALLNHANIAKVFDAGATPGGRPYFVMEYVPGDSITKFCDNQKLSLRHRLELFTQVCRAIAHAHAKGIIHRDIKPSNVLVMLSDGAPTAKVIDFGIAKAINQRLTDQTMMTEIGQAIGTAEYMSPEQADVSELDIDARSDIYSLGVLLYELLTGALPFESNTLRRAALAEVQRIIRDVDPPPPSTRIRSLGEEGTRIAKDRRIELVTLQRDLKRELEWIPMKAMRKERDRRYVSAQQFADDIQNYLENRALIAAPESRSYRVRKFVKRNRRGLMAVSLICVLVIAGGFQMIHSRRMKIELRGRLEDLAVQSNATAILQRAGGKLPEAATLLRKSIDQSRAELGTDHRTTLSLTSNLALVLKEQGLLSDAESLNRDVLGRRRRTFGDDDPDTLLSINNLGAQLRTQGRLAESEPLLNEVFERTRRVHGEDDPRTLTAMNNLATLFQAQRRFSAAETLYRDVLVRRRRALGDDNPETLSSMNSLGALLRDQKKFPEAEQVLRETFARRRKLFGENHRDTTNSMHDLGSLLRAEGKLSDAEPLLRDALEWRRTNMGNHGYTLDSLYILGLVLQQMGRSVEAEPLFKELYDRAPVTQVRDSQRAVYMSRHGIVLAQLGRDVAAENPLAEAHRRLIESGQQSHPATREVLAALAGVCENAGRADEATRWRAELGKLPAATAPWPTPGATTNLSATDRLSG
ncbi:MAG: tetratricopeptide repeat protein [Anaerolineae bacterium]|nr:tetratricopeptide repeat protein [Phycisphaerae bacterium]